MSRAARHIAAIFFLGFFASSIVTVIWPATSGDWDSYGTVAENIHSGRGVSLSRTEPRVPAFGGNSFPGYPAFVATTWLPFGKNLAVTRLAQAFIMALAVALFARELTLLLPAARTGLLFGYSAALSPLMIAWPRHLHAQAPATASVMFFFAACAASLRRGKPRPLPLGAALTAAIYLRTDGLLLMIPLVVTCFFSGFDARSALRGFLGALCLAALGIGAWSVRNVAVGVPGILPPHFLILDAEGRVFPPPDGYLLWGWTWMSREYQRAGWGFPVTRAHYGAIVIPDTAYDDASEKRRVAVLLEKLKDSEQRPFPEEIDSAFRDIAMERIARHPWRTLVILPLKRMLALWIHPGASFGWPLQMDSLSYAERMEFEGNYLKGIFVLWRTHPKELTGKAALALFTTALFAIAGAGALRVIRSKNPIGLGALAYLAGMTVFLGATNYVENRYVSQLSPLIHLLAAFARTAPSAPSRDQSQ